MTTHTPTPAAIDVTGLSADAVRSVEALVSHYRAAAPSLPAPRSLTDPPLTADEFRRLLVELANGPPVPTLPADFSRADLYDDHD